MVVTATEFKTNFGKYLDMLANSESSITITKNGKSVAEVSSPKVTTVEKLSHLLDGKGKRKTFSNKPYDDLKAEALGEKYEITL